MQDKQLLMKAAQAANYVLNARLQAEREAAIPNEPALWLSDTTWWNPLIDSGQALDLAVTLKLNMEQQLPEARVLVTGLALDGESVSHDVPWGSDRRAATRRAIVLAAADLAP